VAEKKVAKTIDSLNGESRVTELFENLVRSEVEIKDLQVREAKKNWNGIDR